MKNQIDKMPLAMYSVQIVLGLALIVFGSDGWTAAGVFLVIWSHNLERHRK